MSKFLSENYAKLTPYTPGEQPKAGGYIKLNTNESPFPPPKSVVEAVKEAGKSLALYSDPENTRLTEKAAEVLGVTPEQVLMTNGSDEALNFAFMAFCDERTPVLFPEISYGFYEVFAKLYNLPYKKILLREDFSIDYRDFCHADGTVVLANPNAPTGLALSKAEVEEIVKSNANNVVVIDEAYVDFGGESAVSLIQKYDNLLVTQTFSKSRSMAGARLGMAIGNERLIHDLKTMKNSTNPYNVNRMTAAAGYALLCEKAWFERGVRAICDAREYTSAALKALGFTVLPSKTNFLFVKTEKVAGERLYQALKTKGILVRHFSGEKVQAYNRVTVGTKAQMQAFLKAVEEILQEEGR